MLSEATYDMTAVAFQKEKDADKALHVHFYRDAVPDDKATIEEGRLICREVDFVMIMVPGDKYSIIRRPVQERDKQRFSDRYRAYKLDASQESAAGTPLKSVTWLSISQKKELEFLGCYTVEQLAGMPDNTTQKFMPLQKLKQQAKDFMDQAKGSAPLLQMRQELTQKDEELANMKKLLAELQGQIGALQNAVISQSQQPTLQEMQGRAARK